MKKYLYIFGVSAVAAVVYLGMNHFLFHNTVTDLNQSSVVSIPQPPSPALQSFYGILKSVESLAADNNPFRAAPSLDSSKESSPTAPAKVKPCKGGDLGGNIVGPRGNVPKGAPKEVGFSDFAILVPGIIGRSGETTKNDLLWLKNQGWKGIVNMTLPGEHGGKDDDTLIPGFAAMGFHYLSLPVASSYAPSQEQAEAFLAFVTDPANQPVLVHCSAGHGRAGTMSALYRYSVQGWPLSKAFEEFKLFDTDGIDSRQKDWLESWAAKNALASFACSAANQISQ